MCLYFFKIHKHKFNNIILFVVKIKIKKMNNITKYIDRIVNRTEVVMDLIDDK